MKGVLVQVVSKEVRFAKDGEDGLFNSAHHGAVHFRLRCTSIAVGDWVSLVVVSSHDADDSPEYGHEEEVDHIIEEENNASQTWSDKQVGQVSDEDTEYVIANQRVKANPLVHLASLTA